MFYSLRLYLTHLVAALSPSQVKSSGSRQSESKIIMFVTKSWHVSCLCCSLLTWKVQHVTLKLYIVLWLLFLSSVFLTGPQFFMLLGKYSMFFVYIPEIYILLPKKYYFWFKNHWIVSILHVVYMLIYFIEKTTNLFNFILLCRYVAWV